jgi:hypothetical protein
MNITYLVSGIICVAFGAWILIKQVRIIIKGIKSNDYAGFDSKGFGGGIVFIAIGICLLVNCK